MPIPKDLPRELRGLLKHQYEPREKVMLKRVSPSTKKMWKELRYARKMEVIDNLQSQDGFGDTN